MVDDGLWAAVCQVSPFWVAARASSYTYGQHHAEKLANREACHGKRVSSVRAATQSAS